MNLRGIEIMLQSPPGRPCSHARTCSLVGIAFTFRIPFGGSCTWPGRWNLAHDPGHDEIHHLPLPQRRKLDAEGNPPPLVQAPPATGRRRMLRREDRMPAHRRLASVVRRTGRREPLPDEILRVATENIEAVFPDVGPIRLRQPEATPELRPRQLPERRLNRHPSPATSTARAQVNLRPRHCGTARRRLPTGAQWRPWGR